MAHKPAGIVLSLNDPAKRYRLEAGVEDIDTIQTEVRSVEHVAHRAVAHGQPFVDRARGGSHFNSSSVFRPTRPRLCRLRYQI